MYLCTQANAARILHEYPSVTRITPRVLENAVAGSTAVRFSLPSVQEYVVSRAFWFILNAMYVRLVQRLRETRQKFTYVYETLCSCWRCSFEVHRRKGSGVVIMAAGYPTAEALQAAVSVLSWTRTKKPCKAIDRCS